LRAVVVGSLNLDIVVDVPRLPLRGESLRGRDWHLYPGGKGGNQAVAFRRLGENVAIVGRVGADEFGTRLRQALAAEGVDARGVLDAPDTPTGVALITVADGGENTIAVVVGANDRVSPADVAAAAPLFDDARVLLVQLEIPLPAVSAAIGLARQRGMLVLLDPAPVPPLGLPDDLLRMVDLVMPNSVEAAALSGRPVHDRDTATEAGRELVRQGARVAVVKLGEHGAVIVTGRDAVHVPAFRVRSVDATAAGDAFAGGLGVALLRGHDLPAAVRFASAVAALSTTHRGAQPSMPTAHAVSAFLGTSARDR